MPFWLHTSKAMLAVSRFALWQKVVACITLIAFALLIGLYGIFLPLKRRRELAQKNLETLVQQKNLFQQKTDHSHHVLQSHATLTKQMNELVAKSYTPQKTMAYLLELMQKHSISCRGIKPQSVTAKNFYQKHHVLIGGRGEFGKILAFLREMEDSSIVTTCKTVSIRKDSYRDLKFQLTLKLISVKDV